MKDCTTTQSFFIFTKKFYGQFDLICTIPAVLKKSLYISSALRLPR